MDLTKVVRGGGEGGLVTGGSVVLVTYGDGDMAKNVTWILSQESSPLMTEWSTGNEVLKSPRTRYK